MRVLSRDEFGVYLVKMSSEEFRLAQRAVLMEDAVPEGTGSQRVRGAERPPDGFIGLPEGEELD